MRPRSAPGAISFDLFGTLVTVDRPTEPGRAIARALAARGVSVPDTWHDAFRQSDASHDPWRERSLTAHVADTLAVTGASIDPGICASAVQEAVDVPVRTREGAHRVVTAAARRGPVGILSNCSVDGLVERVIERADLPLTASTATVSSVDLGWRKPHPLPFRVMADRLGVAPSALVHVGDDPHADRGIAAVGGTALLVSEHSLQSIARRLEEREWPP